MKKKHTHETHEELLERKRRSAKSRFKRYLHDFEIKAYRAYEMYPRRSVVSAHSVVFIVRDLGPMTCHANGIRFIGCEDILDLVGRMGFDF